MHGKSLQPCPTLCDPMDCSPPGSSVHGVLQARILEWLPGPPPGDLPDPGIERRLLCSCVDRRGLHHWATWEALCHSDFTPAGLTGLLPNRALVPVGWQTETVLIREAENENPFALRVCALHSTRPHWWKRSRACLDHPLVLFIKHSLWLSPVL